MTVPSLLSFAPVDPLRDLETGESIEIARRLEAAIWIFDIDRAAILFANAAACVLWQASSEDELRGRDLSLDMSTTVAKRLKQYQHDFSQIDATFTEMWTLYPDGQPTSVMVVFRGFRLSDGRMAMQCEALGTSQDQPENLRSAEALLHTDVLITLFSTDGPPLYLNPAARNAFPAPIERLENLILDRNEYVRLTKQVRERGEFRLVTKMRTVSGDRWFDLSTKSCLDAATGKPALLVTAIDVTELKEARDTARYLADRDQLTNLHNRNYLQRFFALLETGGGANGCTVILFDVDRFKLINDRNGHDAGDTVLREIATRAGKALQNDDLVARLGGDEFVVVINRETDPSTLANEIEQLRRAIAAPVFFDQTRIDVTISVGVAKYTPEASSFSNVMREADIALYAAKQGGRNRTVTFNTAMGEAALARDRLEIALKRAVNAEEFVLHYQPRLDIQSGKIVGAEGLARWQHPELGIVMPGAFIPICEETGLIDQLGRFILEMGCKQAIKWYEAGLDLKVSLNVSPRQFADDSFLSTLNEIAARPDFPYGKIELEITETALIGEHDRIGEKLRAITAIGYKIAIDDFGTGYSNLSYISRFPLTCLKIDRSFIDQLPGSGPIVQLILTLAQQIGATVVSEGVETREQLDWLTGHKCDEAQGFLITAAMKPSDFEDFIKDFKAADLRKTKP